MITGHGGKHRASSVGMVALVAVMLTLLPGTWASAAVTMTTQHGALITDFDALLSSSDLIHGRATEGVDVYTNPFDTSGNPSVPGWHEVNDDPLDQLPAFTDGIGMRSTNFTGLLNDNYPENQQRSGRPAKIVEYPFESPVDIGRINILTGNNLNADGRIFSTTYIEYSTDNGFSYQPLGYFQSDPSGTINNAGLPLEQQRKSTFVSIFDDTSATLVSGVTNLIFNLYSVDNTQGQMRDPFGDIFTGVGVNPFTGTDDGLTPPAVSPLVLEIDVLAPVEGQLGDHNGDGSVDAADYVAGRKLPDNFGGDPAWYNDFRAHFGEAAPGGSVAVPEPSALAMLIALALGALLRSNRNLI